MNNAFYVSVLKKWLAAVKEALKIIKSDSIFVGEKEGITFLKIYLKLQEGHSSCPEPRGSLREQRHG